MKPITQNEIMRFLPHRFPFVLVDQITAYEPGKSATGVKNVAVREPLFVAEGEKYWPAGLIIESIGQLTIALYNLTTKDEQVAEILLGSVSGVEIFERVPLGSQIRLEAVVQKFADDSLIFGGSAYVGDKRVLAVDTFVAMKRPKA